MKIQVLLILLIFLFTRSSLCFSQSDYEIRDLESTTQAEFRQETMDWMDEFGNTGTAFDTQCGSTYLMGGYGYALNSAYFSRKYENLPAHSFIILTYDAYIIDAVGGELPVQSVGSSGSQTAYPVFPFALADPLPTLPNDFCGSTVKDAGPITVFQVIPHSDSTLYFNWVKGLNIPNLGIRNVKILIVVADLSAAPSCNIADPLSLVAGFDCQCSTGLYSASCTACDDACGDCYGGDASSCFTIKDGYYFDGTTSEICDNSCGTCSGSGPSACITCPWGDPADTNNECPLVCDDACDTCTGPYFNMCSVCNDGYYFDGSTSCFDCDGTCETCSGAGASACLTCPWGDPADVNNECNLVCYAACDTCYGSNANSCYSCKDGYYFDGVLDSCPQCDTSCETCSGPGANACLTCPWGGSANANNECILNCDKACSVCSGTTSNTCSACHDGYYSDGASSCLSCDSACKTCSGAGSCDSCNNGDYFDGASSCLGCDSACKTCSGPGPNACEICPLGDPADANSECTEPPVKPSTKRITDIKKTTQTVVGAWLIANTLFNPGSSGAVRISMLAQMIQYIKYLDINYPYDVRYAISNWDNDFINFSNDDSDLTPNSLAGYGSAYGQLPSPFTMYDDEIDPSFLINFWEQMITLWIVSAILIFVAVLEVIVSRKNLGETSKLVIHQLRICFQGLLITYLYDDFADIFFFAILSYRTTKKATALTIINIIVSILFIVIACGALIAHNWLVRKYQNIKNKDQERFEKFELKIEGAKILWRDCKEDSFIEMNALFFSVLHNILFCFILSMLYKHPLAQVILINILSLVMLGYLLWFRPLDEKREFIQAIILEAILFAVNICLLILVILDSSSNSREGVGQAILVLTLVFNFIPLIFLAISLIPITIKIYRTFKAYQLKRKLEKLKKTGVHFKKSQIVPESVKDDMSIITKYHGNIEMTQTNSLVLIPQSSHATNVLSPESGDQPNFNFSPSKQTLNLVGLSDNEDQFLKVEDGVDSKRDSAKFSRTSLFANRQQKIFRKRAHLKTQINPSVHLDCQSQSLAE